MNEETVLLKAFKYFDLNNNGVVEPDEFAKAIEKIGIMIPTKQVRNPRITSFRTLIASSDATTTTAVVRSITENSAAPSSVAKSTALPPPRGTIPMSSSTVFARSLPRAVLAVSSV